MQDIAQKLTRLGALEEIHIKILKNYFTVGERYTDGSKKLSAAVAATGKYSPNSVKTTCNRLRANEDFTTTLNQFSMLGAVEQRHMLNVLDEVWRSRKRGVEKVIISEFTKNFPLGVDHVMGHNRTQKDTKTDTSHADVTKSQQLTKKERKMSKDELLAFWSGVVNGTDGKEWPPSAVCRCSELLARALGMFDEPPKEVVVKEPFSVSQQVLAALTTDELVALQGIMAKIKNVEEKRTDTTVVSANAHNPNFLH